MLPRHVTTSACVSSYDAFAKFPEFSTELMHPSLRTACKQISVPWQTAEVSV